MSRPPRIEFAGAIHHVMPRGDRREEIFRDDRDRLKFLGYLADGAEQFTEAELVRIAWSRGDPGTGQ